MCAIPIHASITDLAATSDAWIVDIWGVMHNGECAYQAAAEAARAFRAAGEPCGVKGENPEPRLKLRGGLPGMQ